MGDVPKRLVRSIARVAMYLEYDEQKDFEASGYPKDHIWWDILRIKRWLHKINIKERQDGKAQSNYNCTA